MKILWALLIFCVSCHSDKRSDTTTKIPEKTKVPQTKKLKIEPDVFVIGEELSKKFGSGKNLDFFQSKNDNAKLFLIPYADGAITTAILTRSELLPYYKELLASENLNMNTAGLNPIYINQIVSHKGVSIRSTKADIFSIFGRPEKTVKENELDLLMWNFTMKEFKSEFNSYNLQPFILDSLALDFDVSIYFKGDSIQTLLYEYQVP